MRRILILATLLMCMPPRSFSQTASSADSARRLDYPVAVDGDPAAGKRVRVTPPEYLKSKLHYTLYLPRDWSRSRVLAGERWPVIVEYAGNQSPQLGSAGTVEGARFGYGVSAGKFIWVVLPFVSPDGKSNQLHWWGDVDATVAYAKTNVPRICEQFGGDAKVVFLSGFSRGAIATSFIGLHDDEIAKLWCAFITHDHFDGVRSWGTKWGSPLDAYRTAAKKRLARLYGRSLLVCQAKSTEDVRMFLEPHVAKESVTYLDVDPLAILGKFPNKIAIHPHTDGWLGLPSDTRQSVWNWIDTQVIRARD